MIDTALVPVAVCLSLLGLIVGSFLNLVAVRLPNAEPIFWARSRTDCCRVPLRPLELVPVVSWLAQRGRCSRCGDPLTARHPIVELLAAFLGLWAGLASDGLTEALLSAALAWQLLLIALIDADQMWIPDRLSAPLWVSGVAAGWLSSNSTIMDAVIGSVVAFSALWAVSALYRRLRGREGLGGGDPILFAGIGAWVGWMGLPTALCVACAAALSWILARRLLGRPWPSDRPLAFGPWLAIGAWLTWIFGPMAA